MADIKTHLRELSVATTVGMLLRSQSLSASDLYQSKDFFALASQVVSNNIQSATNLLEYPVFTGELQTIVNNGYKLGCSIVRHPHFHIDPDAPIYWLGNNTQKDDPVDVSIGGYGFSLKEDSFILKNMGLYQLLNILTGKNHARGLHVFSYFAQEEYDKWFSYSWNALYAYLCQNSSWTLQNGNDESSITLQDNAIVLRFNRFVSRVPVDIGTNQQYIRYTTSKTREKVFSKWIKTELGADEDYLRLKKRCAETAGRKVCDFIEGHFDPSHVHDFFRIHSFEYYYAKTTASETTILRVPSKRDFHSVVEFQGCRYEVPRSQLNIITTFQNITTKKRLEFRNECRFSHGQFNGTPEAKMYVVRGTSLFDLYEPI